MPDKQKPISPWLRGIVDTLLGAEILRVSGIPTKNRLVVILIDSAFETACRAFLKHVSGIKLDQNHTHRDNLVKAVKAKLPDIDKEVWARIDYYYTEIRCDFYHQSAGKTLTDNDLLDYQETVEFLIDHAFTIKTAELVRAQGEAMRLSQAPTPASERPQISLRELAEDRDKVLLAVALISPKSPEDMNTFFKQQGERLRLKPNEFTNVLARNSGTKRFFFHNRETHTWELSDLGKFRLKQLEKGDGGE